MAEANINLLGDIRLPRLGVCLCVRVRRRLDLMADGQEEQTRQDFPAVQLQNRKESSTESIRGKLQGICFQLFSV